MKFNPFDRYKKGFDLSTQNPTDFLNTAVGSATSTRIQRQEEKTEGTDQKVNITQFPRHLFTPEGARSIDIRNLAIIPPATTFDILVFTAPEATTVFFTHYAIFNDALLFANVEFLPTVNHRRIYPFHGEPSNNFKIALGLAPDLSNNSLIEGQLQVNPSETVRWTVTNSDVVDVVMGVRMKGYIDSTTSRINRVFGG